MKIRRFSLVAVAILMIAWASAAQAAPPDCPGRCRGCGPHNPLCVAGVWQCCGDVAQSVAVPEAAPMSRPASDPWLFGVTAEFAVDPGCFAAASDGSQ